MQFASKANNIIIPLPTNFLEHGCNDLILHCVCLKALEVTVTRDGWQYKQTYSRGKPITNLISHELPSNEKDLKGTTIHFWPDKDG